MRIWSVHRAMLPAVALLLAAMATGCSRQQETPPANAAPATTAGPQPAADASIPATSSPFDALPATVRLAINRLLTGDLDEMVGRHAIRVAVTFNRTHYFIDKGQERGRRLGRLGRETVTCVSNIYKYYIAYRLMAAQRDRRDAAKAAVRERK